MNNVPSGRDAGRNSQEPDRICTGYPRELSPARVFWSLPKKWAGGGGLSAGARFVSAQLADLAVFGARMAFANTMLAERGFILPTLEADNWALGLTHRRE